MQRQKKHWLNLSISMLTIALVYFLAMAGTNSHTDLVPYSLAAPYQQTSGLSWDPSSGTLQVAAGATNQLFKATLKNTGTQTETITLTSGNVSTGWTISYSPTPPANFKLAPGEKQDFTIIVSVPASATPVDNFTYNLNATSSLGPTFKFSLAMQVLTATATNTPVTSSPSVELSVSGDSAKKEAPGTVVTYKVKIRNPGNAQGRYNITFPKTCADELKGCAESPGQSTFLLNANEEREFQVSVIIPSGAAEGTVARTIVRATLETNSNVYSQVELITTVKEAPTPTNTRTPTQTPTPGRICKDYYEIDNNFDQARFIEVNVSQPKPSDQKRTDDPDDRRAICPAGDEDWLKFSAVGGKIYTIDVTQMANGIDLSLELFTDKKVSLAFNDDYFSKREGRDNTDANDIRPRIDSWQAPKDGVYYIRVRDSGGRGGIDGTYTIIVRSESYGPTPVTINQVCEDKFEPDGLPEQGALITSNERQEERTLCPTGDADWVKFFGKKGKRYFIQTDTDPYAPDSKVNNMQAGADTILTLFDRDGTSILDSNDDIPGGNTFDSEVEFVPEADGFYYVQIKNTGDIGNQFIRYNLTLVLCLPDQSNCSRSGSSSSTTKASMKNQRDTPTPTPTIPQEEFSLDETSTTIPYTPVSMYASQQQTLEPTPTNTPTSSDSLANVHMQSNETRYTQPHSFVQEIFWRIWQRNDQPVMDRRVVRSWLWGLTALIARQEPYTQAEGGIRQVQYFDKGRMEINDPNADPADPWFVTFGLLAQEMIYHQIQVGEGEFINRSSAHIALIGDSDDSSAPTYASFHHVLGKPFPDLTGEYVMDKLDREGNVTIYSGTPHPEVQLTRFITETQHNIPLVFWEFLNQQGEIYHTTTDEYRVDYLLNWQQVVGLPISEPYWIQVRINRIEQQVLIQAFQRRVLSYIPNQPTGEKVRMIDVGRHYYQWRYGEKLP